MTDAPPRRIQRRRTKGWWMPEGAVYVGRGSPWGNPWSIATARKAGVTGTDKQLAALCVALFRNGMASRLPACEAIADRIGELRGKTLMCWCAAGEPCHADVLLEIANA